MVKYLQVILITHVCGSRDHINIEHAYSGYSLPKRDLIHRERSGNCVWTLSSLYPLSHHGWIRQILVWMKKIPQILENIKKIHQA